MNDMARSSASSSSSSQEENDQNGLLKKGPWTGEEDRKLVDYIEKHGHGCWRALPKFAGLNRCGKSCRLRWNNYLRPDIKRGNFSHQEQQFIINLHAVLGNKWSMIASHLPGRTDNEIKNFWNTHLKKKLLKMGIDPITHMPRIDLNLNNALANLDQHLLISAINLTTIPNLENFVRELQPDASQIGKIQLLRNIIQLLTFNNTNNIQQVGLMSDLPFESPDVQFQIPNPNFHIYPNSEESLPNLVPFSPDCSNNINQVMENERSEIYLNPLLSKSTKNALEDQESLLGDFMDIDEHTESYWKDIIKPNISPGMDSIFL